MSSSTNDEQQVPEVTTTIKIENYENTEQIVADIVNTNIKSEYESDITKSEDSLAENINDNTELVSNTETIDSNTENVTTSKEAAVAMPTDSYHYLNLGEFSSENFKVVVQNFPIGVPYGWFRGEIKKALNFAPKKIKYNARSKNAYIACSNKEEQEKAVTCLNGYKWKGKILVCKIAPPAKDPYVEANKRKRNDSGYQKFKKYKSESNHDEDEFSHLPPEERLVHVVCPLSKYSYEEQLKIKTEEISKAVENLTTVVKRESLSECWKNEKGDLVCLNLEEMIPSPVLTHYRNKVEFTIGVGPDDQDNTIGFRLGSYRTGSMLIVHASKCNNCSNEAVAVAQEFETFIQTLPYASYNICLHTGLWQQLFVRTSTTMEMMLIIQIHRKELSDDDYATLVEKIKDYFISDNRSNIKVSSIYMAWSSQSNSNVDIYEHIALEKHITETLLGCKFRITAYSFFQVNTPAAEILYSKVLEWCDTSQPNSCILDVCCGTGTIGICMASKTPLPVYGVEISEQAVEDAKYNAHANNIKNAEFLCGPAEKILKGQLVKLNYDNIIAIVDPPRAGLHRDVVDAIRGCASIKKIVYVACSPKQAVDNFLNFCRPMSKRRPGIPFKPTKAVPVDLFPQTKHCELIVELVRLT